MKKQSLKALTIKDGKTISANASKAIYLLLGAREVEGRCRFHGKYWSNRASLVSGDYDRFVELFEKLGVHYVTGNDAPRGGVVGDFVEISARDKREIERLVKTYTTSKGITFYDIRHTLNF